MSNNKQKQQITADVLVSILYRIAKSFCNLVDKARRGEPV